MVLLNFLTLVVVMGVITYMIAHIVSEGAREDDDT